MKRFFTVAFTFALLGFATQAKAGHAENEKKAKAESQKLTQELLLTPEQESRVYAIALDFYDQREALKAEKNADTKKQGLTALRNDSKSKMKIVLTYEQYTKWNKMLEEEKAKKAQGK